MQKLNTILLIDDDRINNFLNERLFRKLNIADNVVISHNGKEGLNYLVEITTYKIPEPEAIFLDINMPVMDGFDFLISIKTHALKLNSKIIILTTSKNHKDIERLRQLGDFSFINKPLTAEKIIDCLKTETA